MAFDRSWEFQISFEFIASLLGSKENVNKDTKQVPTQFNSREYTYRTTSLVVKVEFSVCTCIKYKAGVKLGKLTLEFCAVTEF